MRNRRQVRATAKTRSWERANQDARALEERLEAAERGLPSAEPVASIALDDAVNRFLADKKTQGLGHSALKKQTHVMGMLQDFCKPRNLLFLDEVKADHLSTWRNGWKLKIFEGGELSFSWKVYRAIGGGLFRYGLRMGWLAVNEASKLSGFKIKRRQVQPFSPEQMAAILKAATDPRTKAFILLMRWSGLSCQDAACLPRAALDSQDRVHTICRKTKTDVCVSIPGFVAETLRAHKNSNAEYFFWDGVKRRESISGEFQDILRKVFDAAKVYDGTSHRFRHTFSVELLKAGTSLEHVSKLLGHESVSTTQKYYAAWVKGRQTLLDAEVKKAWAAMGVPE